jgi:hypothetical protein
MKTRVTLLAIAAVTMIAIPSCKKNKDEVKTPDPKGEVVINEYCSGDQFKSTKDAFRSTATGESMDRETAKKKARSNAMSEMGKTISATMKIVGDNYVNSTEVNNKEEVTESFNEMARTVVDQELRGCIEICEKLTQRPDGTYVSYVALELSGNTIADAYQSGLSKNDKLKADYNYEKFKETFDKEMEKLSQGK